jgi:hypothetical protein
MLPEKFERQIATSTKAGREGLAVWDHVMRSMTGERKVAKAFELTGTTRQIMRAGIRSANPDASEAEIQELYVDRLLHYHATSLAEVRRKQGESSQRQG